MYVNGESITCNNCSRPVNIRLGYYRCDQVTCDFDICANCGVAADLDELEEVEVVKS